VGSPARLKLADFYLAFQKPEGASESWRRSPRKLLGSSGLAPLAEVALVERKYEKASRHRGESISRCSK